MVSPSPCFKFSVSTAMAASGENSSSRRNRKATNPEVKRKAVSPIDTFRLATKERPLKRALLEFEKLSISGSSKKALASDSPVSPTMAAIGESSSGSPNHTDAKPVVVRVKRKAYMSPLDAFWLEINDRPLKRTLLDLEKLSIASSSKKEELKNRKVFLQHVETVSSNEATVNIVQSFVELKSAEVSESKSKSVDRRQVFKKENENKQDHMLSKARQKQEAVAKNARFEQIWKSRKEIKEPKNENLKDICHFYDIVRVDVEERAIEERANEGRANEEKQREETLEDHKMLQSYLPLLREFIPSAANEIESDLLDHTVGQDRYVYDYYTVKDELDETDMDASNPFPLVQVDEEEDFYDGPNYSDYESDDSNAEDNPLNDYPEEMSEEDESEDSDDESEEESDGESSSELVRSQKDPVLEHDDHSGPDYLCDLDQESEDEGSIYGDYY